MPVLILSYLSPETRRLVQDVHYRARLTVEVLQSDPSSVEFALARDAVDAAVVEILASAGLPRGPINDLLVEHVGRGWFGRKMPDCTMMIDKASFLLTAEPDRPDSLLKTWIHESLHARRAYAPGFRREWQNTCGYEEGLAEGLARLITDELEFRPSPGRFDFYVSAYRTLAAALDVEAEGLLCALWTYPAGDVRAALPTVVERILPEGQAMSRLQRARFVIFAERHFSTERMSDRPDDRTLFLAWRSIFA